MRALIAATSEPGKGHDHGAEHGQCPRVDYIELARRLETDYVDYGVIRANNALQWIEQRVRMDLRQAWRVGSTVRSEHYSVVFSMSERLGIPLSPILDHKTKHIVLGHHLMSSSKLALLKVLHVSSRWDQIIVPTRAEVAPLRRELRLGADQIHMMYNTVDTAFYTPAADMGTTAEDHVLSLGLAHRDYSTLLIALRCLPHIECRISANSLWTKGGTSVAGATLPANAVLVPQVPANKLRDRYAACRFVIVPILPDTTHWSAGTNTVMMAQAMGKAVIATRNPGIADYVADGINGILVDGANPAALAEAVEYLWNSPGKAVAMGHRAREHAEANYSLDLWLEHMVTLLNQVSR